MNHASEDLSTEFLATSIIPAIPLIFLHNLILLYSKKSKLTNVHRLPSLYIPTLIKSEFNYQREMRRKLNQIEHESHELIRRHQTNHHLFAHSHLTKRHLWFNLDKSYRETCRTTWNRQTNATNRTSHVFLPSIYPKECPSRKKSNFQVEENDSSVIADEKIKQKFLYTQPVMIEILNAPHSYQAFKYKSDVQLRKQSAQRRHVQIQTTAIDDQRYRELVFSLQDT